MIVIFKCSYEDIFFIFRVYKLGYIFFKFFYTFFFMLFFIVRLVCFWEENKMSRVKEVIYREKIL